MREEQVEGGLEGRHRGDDIAGGARVQFHPEPAPEPDSEPEEKPGSGWGSGSFTGWLPASHHEVGHVALAGAVARATNAAIGHFEGFWADNASYSSVEPLTPGDVVEKIGYVLANPVAAGLVKRAAEWPGLWTAPDQIGNAKLVARKPKVFFDPNGQMPETVELELTIPPGFASAEEFRSAVAAELAMREKKHAADLASEGRRVLGVARVLAQSPFSRPSTAEPRFGLKPRIASRDKWKRIEALFRLKAFAQSYREARSAWRSGVRDVVFPSGTYLLRIMHGVQCAGAA